jgi:tetratricopeptide (TPR) repeat protein
MSLLRSMLLASAVLAMAAACSGTKDGGWNDVVRRAHRTADEQRTTDVAATERALRSAIEQAPDVPDERQRWVIQDLYYRLGQLLFDVGATDRALDEIEEGLRVSEAPTLARANLVALKGKALAKLGDRQAAAEALHAALLINEALMDLALAGALGPQTR